MFLRTLREDPADADVDSAKLLQRAGYIRKAAPGIWTWLPLGLRVLNKIEAIIREEINGIGAQEVHFPALLPREPYEATHRWEEYGDNIFRLKDRHEADYLLAPTHEEMFTLLVKDMYSSYKDLPVTLYQIQTKYRDEFRPRAGLIRGREFVMKDAYSFTIDEEGMRKAYYDERGAYGNDVRITQAGILSELHGSVLVEVQVVGVLGKFLFSNSGGVFLGDAGIFCYSFFFFCDIRRRME